MTDTRADGISTLEKKLGYAFSDVSLLERAITHSSLSNENDNIKSLERLEFLGDRVLGLLAAEALWRTYPDFSEGDMAPRLNAMVRKETCARAAQSVGLSDIIRLSEAEAESGGRQKTAILGDVCEAVLGALYIDGGLPAASKLFDLFWTPNLEKLTRNYKDSKTALQEWAQGQLKAMPQYSVLNNDGPAHAPRFEVEVRVGDLAPATGTGHSKRVAQTRAAKKLLLREQIWTEEDVI